MKKFSAIDKASLLCFIFIFCLSSVSLCINHFYWHYPILSYFVHDTLSVFFVLLFCFLGSVFSLGKLSHITERFTYALFYLLVMMLVMYATTAVQLTPFKPIDQFLLKIDLLLHFHAAKIMETLYNHPIFVKFFLYKAYNFLNYEVLLLPAFLIFFRYFNVLKEFIFYVLITLLIGYLIYYFFPTTAPASILYSPHFLPEQLNTGKKFYELHHYISPESGAGGLIAMPSFHVLWALICQQSTWHLKWLWLILLPLNILIILAALLLGWHYLADILGSACILGIAWRMEQVLIRVQTA